MVMMPAFIAPALLVFLSSTSFIAARAVAPHADPILFLFIRLLLVVAIFAFLARNVPWPKGWQFVGHLVAGMVINGVYLVASWWAVGQGLAAGVMTLMGGIAAAVRRLPHRNRPARPDCPASLAPVRGNFERRPVGGFRCRARRRDDRAGATPIPTSSAHLLAPDRGLRDARPGAARLPQPAFPRP